MVAFLYRFLMAFQWKMQWSGKTLVKRYLPCVNEGFKEILPGWPVVCYNYHSAGSSRPRVDGFHAKTPKSRKTGRG